MRQESRDRRWIARSAHMPTVRHTRIAMPKHGLFRWDGLLLSEALIHRTEKPETLYGNSLSAMRPSRTPDDDVTMSESGSRKHSCLKDRELASSLLLKLSSISRLTAIN